MKLEWSRRDVLKIGAAATLSACGGNDGEPDVGTTTTVDAPPGVRTRPDVNSLALDDPRLQAYRDAVQNLVDRPPSDPLSWERLARIHEDFCPHGNWFFLPWHRAYLHAFEEICRKASGDDSFALPYWDWTRDPVVPPAFVEPTWQGGANPLFNGTRLAGGADTIPIESTGVAVMDEILAETDFELFASFRPIGQDSIDSSFQRRFGGKSTLERTPHDQVHVWVGGDMLTFLSPLDPVFWLHHCNVDRIWSEWTRAGNSNSTETLWTDFTFGQNFVDPGGQPFDVDVGDLGATEPLGYRYDRLGPLFTRTLAGMGSGRRLEALERLSSAVTAPVPVQLKTESVLLVPLPGSDREVVGSASIERGLEGEGPRVVAFLRGVTAPEDLNVLVRVFLNHDELGPLTPSNDPHFVGTFAFFGGRHASHRDAVFAFDLTRTLERLRRTQRSPSRELRVQLMPVPFAGRDVENGQFSVAGVDVLFLSRAG